MVSMSEKNVSQDEISESPLSAWEPPVLSIQAVETSAGGMTNVSESNDGLLSS